MEPPKDYSPSALWLKLQETPAPTDVVDFPRKDKDGQPIGRVRIRVLTMEQHEACRIRAHAKLIKSPRIDKDALSTQGSILREVEGDMVAREVLWMACLCEKPFNDTERPKYAQAFPSAEALGQFLTADELAILFALYQQVQAKFGPYEFPNFEGPQLDVWIRRLAEGASRFPLALLSSPLQEELISSLAERSFSVFRTLDSQWESLPPTLKSALESSGFGIGCYGEPLEPSLDADGLGDLDPVDLDEAKRLAKSMK